MSLRHKSLLALLLLLPLACRTAEPPVLESASLGSIQRVHAFGDVWLASQPTPSDLEAARAAGVRAVVNLRAPTEPLEFDERRLALNLGMTYSNPGFGSPAELSDEVFASALEALDDARGPVLLHCSSANRVGPIWIARRVLEDGVDVEVAVQEALRIGMRTPEYEQLARDYVRRHAN